MYKLFHHVAGHKLTAQKQLCSFNPIPFSQHRAGAVGGSLWGEPLLLTLAKFLGKE